jgi:hypothetical protein
MTLAPSIVEVVTTQEQFVETGAMKTRMGYHYKGYDEDQGHVSSF